MVGKSLKLSFHTRILSWAVTVLSLHLSLLADESPFLVSTCCHKCPESQPELQVPQNTCFRQVVAINFQQTSGNSAPIFHNNISISSFRKPYGHWLCGLRLLAATLLPWTYAHEMWSRMGGVWWSEPVEDLEDLPCLPKNPLRAPQKSFSSSLPWNYTSFRIGNQGMMPCLKAKSSGFLPWKVPWSWTAQCRIYCSIQRVPYQAK